MVALEGRHKASPYGIYYERVFFLSHRIAYLIDGRYEINHKRNFLTADGRPRLFLAVGGRIYVSPGSMVGWRRARWTTAAVSPNSSKISPIKINISVWISAQRPPSILIAIKGAIM